MILMIFQNIKSSVGLSFDYGEWNYEVYGFFPQHRMSNDIYIALIPSQLITRFLDAIILVFQLYGA